MATDPETLVTFGPLAEVEALIAVESTFLVTDPFVQKVHGSDFPPCRLALVERGEGAKSLAGLEALWKAFLEAGLDRSSTVLAVGGGSVSDLAGFAAATWLRGVDFGFCPSTLLAMVDAAVGGKNAIDFGGLKNLVGTFRKPRFVHIDVALALSLPGTALASGMAEAIKHGILEGGEHFAYLEASCASPAMADPASLDGVVRRSVAYKAGVTARDPLESGERRLLNLGHTIGHGVEAVTGLPHGHAVAAGLGAALELASRRGGADPHDRARILGLLEAWSLPTSLAAAQAAAEGLGLPRQTPEDFRAAVAAAAGADKKREGDLVRFILPYGIGRVAVESLPYGDLVAFIKEAP